MEIRVSRSRYVGEFRDSRSDEPGRALGPSGHAVVLPSPNSLLPNRPPPANRGAPANLGHRQHRSIENRRWPTSSITFRSRVASC